MSRRHGTAIGLTLLIAGLAVIAIGTIFPSPISLVALGWLLFVPMLLSLCGTILVLVGLVRTAAGAGASERRSLIVWMAAAAGLGVALAYGAAGFLSQVPDTLAGLNGPFVPGPGAGLSALLLSGAGLSVGLLTGAIASLTWWSWRGRHLPPT